jgi:hypothetical protein
VVDEEVEVADADTAGETIDDSDDEEKA